MRKNLKKAGQECDIIYAEALNQIFFDPIFSKMNKSSSVFFVTTQPFYEMYYTKLTSLLNNNQLFEWYICPNNETINYLKTFQTILSFIEKMKLPAGTIIIGAGNNYIYHLCAFLKKTSLYFDYFIYFSTTLNGFSEALQGNAYLNNQYPFSIGVKECVLPNILIYDKMLSDLENKATHLQDFHNMLILAITSDSDLFNSLVSTRSMECDINLTPYIAKVIDIKRNNSLDFHVYLSAFTKGFYHLVESHYLSRNQKEHIAFLLYFLWCIQKGCLDFDFKQFFLWYEATSSFKLRIPEKMNTYELAESITKELERFKSIIGIYPIGNLTFVDSPNLEEMYRAIETFRQIEDE